MAHRWPQDAGLNIRAFQLGILKQTPRGTGSNITPVSRATLRVTVKATN